MHITKYYGKNIATRGFKNTLSTPSIAWVDYVGTMATTDVFASAIMTTDSNDPYWYQVAQSRPDPPEVRVFTTKKGYKITIKPDGDYEIEAPENLVLEEYLRVHPRSKILDANANVLEFTDGKLTQVEQLLGSSGRVIEIRDPLVRVRDTLMGNSFGKIAIPTTGCRLLLPDQTELIVHPDGGYEINEANKTFTYKAAPRNFNKFLNASDVLEEFIRYLGALQVRQRHVMQMPLGLYLKWLIIQAAKADGDPWEDVEPPLVEGVRAVKAQPRCNFCKRFISQARADRGVHFCSPRHMEQFLLREDLDRPQPRRKPLLQIAAPPSDSYFPMAAE